MSCSSLAGALGILGIILLAELVAPGVAPAAEPSVEDNVQDLLQVSGEQRRGLVQGEVVSYPVAENSERELTVGLAMLMSAPLSQVANYLASGQLIAQDATISEFGTVPDGVSFGDLVGPRFTSGERAEAESFLDASPGTGFNLSLDELEALRALTGSAGSSVRTRPVELASDA